MSDGGKGSKPRPLSVSQDEFANNWNLIFAKNEERRQKIESDFQDILATEDCLIDALKKLKKEKK
jgi:hypothetical protein